MHTPDYKPVYSHLMTFRHHWALCSGCADLQLVDKTWTPSYVISQCILFIDYILGHIQHLYWVKCPKVLRLLHLSHWVFSTQQTVMKTIFGPCGNSTLTLKSDILMLYLLLDFICSPNICFVEAQRRSWYALIFWICWTKLDVQKTLAFENLVEFFFFFLTKISCQWTHGRSGRGVRTSCTCPFSGL